jgi:hypothetical protein
MRQVLEVAADSDGLIVAGLAAFIGFSAAEKLAVPVIGAGMIPLTPTSALPSPFLPPGSMPRWLNRFSYRLVAELLWRAFRKAPNRRRPNDRDAGAGFGRRRKDARKTAWQRLSGEFTPWWHANLGECSDRVKLYLGRQLSGIGKRSEP